MALHSIYDLTTFARRTRGATPPKLVGASTTVVGNRVYLFGGRLVQERRMVADLWAFDTQTFTWEAITPASPPSRAPRARYFHSSDAFAGRWLLVFGGMSAADSAERTANPDDLCVLADLHAFDTQTGHWTELGGGVGLGGTSQTSAAPDDASLAPRARYAHLSSVTGHNLYIIGGQDYYNTWLDDICVFDLRAGRWVQRQPYNRHCGTYRSVAVSSPSRVRYPLDELPDALLGADHSDANPFGQPTCPDTPEATNARALVHLPYQDVEDPDSPSPPIDDDKPEGAEQHDSGRRPHGVGGSEIWVYSNYNVRTCGPRNAIFTLTRNPFLCTRACHPRLPLGIFLRSRHQDMPLPPGLRFPGGFLLGGHLLLCGTYLAHSFQSFSIWALHLGGGGKGMSWSRIDCGSVLQSGSWFRSVLVPAHGSAPDRLLIFGDRAGNLVDDYNKRLLSWEHVAVVDLEAFGVYSPPKARIPPNPALPLPMGALTSPLTPTSASSVVLSAQLLGLRALEAGVAADFWLVCEDGRKVACSRKILESRWPWFRRQMDGFVERARRTAASMPPNRMHVPLKAGPSGIDEDEELGVGAGLTPRGASMFDGDADGARDPRLMPRSFNVPAPYPVVVALLQYLYTLALVTPLQHAPAVLSQLLILSRVCADDGEEGEEESGGMAHLRALVRHAMHCALGNSNSVGVYEVATLCGERGLQIRALRTVMAYTSKKGSTDKSKSRSRGDRDRRDDGSAGGGAGGNATDTSTGGGSVGGAPSSVGGSSFSASRARGTSDATWRTTGFQHDGSAPNTLEGLPEETQAPIPMFSPTLGGTSSSHALTPTTLAARVPLPTSPAEGVAGSPGIALAAGVSLPTSSEGEKERVVSSYFSYSMASQAPGARNRVPFSPNQLSIPTSPRRTPSPRPAPGSPLPPVNPSRPTSSSGVDPKRLTYRGGFGVGGGGRFATGFGFDDDLESEGKPLANMLEVAPSDPGLRPDLAARVLVEHERGDMFGTALQQALQTLAAKEQPEPNEEAQPRATETTDASALLIEESALEAGHQEAQISGGRDSSTQAVPAPPEAEDPAAVKEASTKAALAAPSVRSTGSDAVSASSHPASSSGHSSTPSKPSGRRPSHSSARPANGVTRAGQDYAYSTGIIPPGVGLKALFTGKIPPPQPQPKDKQKGRMRSGSVTSPTSPTASTPASPTSPKKSLLGRRAGLTSLLPHKGSPVSPGADSVSSPNSDFLSSPTSALTSPDEDISKRLEAATPKAGSSGTSQFSSPVISVSASLPNAPQLPKKSALRQLPQQDLLNAQALSRKGAISPPADGRAATNNGLLSPPSAHPPFLRNPPSDVLGAHHRQVSIVSLATDQEMFEVAGLMGYAGEDGEESSDDGSVLEMPRRAPPPRHLGDHVVHDDADRASLATIEANYADDDTIPDDETVDFDVYRRESMMSTNTDGYDQGRAHDSYIVLSGPEEEFGVRRQMRERGMSLSSYQSAPRSPLSSHSDTSGWDNESDSDPEPMVRKRRVVPSIYTAPSLYSQDSAYPADDASAIGHHPAALEQASPDAPSPQRSLATGTWSLEAEQAKRARRMDASRRGAAMALEGKRTPRISDASRTSTATRSSGSSAPRQDRLSNDTYSDTPSLVSCGSSMTSSQRSSQYPNVPSRPQTGDSSAHGLGIIDESDAVSIVEDAMDMEEDHYPHGMVGDIAEEPRQKSAVHVAPVGAAPRPGAARSSTSSHSTSSSSAASARPSSSSGGGGLMSKFGFSRKKSPLTSDPTFTALPPLPSSTPPLSDKDLKAEAKRIAKQEARIRRERLAEDLRKRQDAAKAARKPPPAEVRSVGSGKSSSSSSTRRRSKANADAAAMYGGMTGFTM
ncbi:hypothetical protein GGG16DRAFT_89620 [Schizophyllum commune]